MFLPIKNATLIFCCAVSAVAGQGSDPYFGQPPVGSSTATEGLKPETEVRFFNRHDVTMPVQVFDSSTRELRLFVSADQGRNWRLHSRSRPDVRSVVFNAPSDGEYWFALHTLTPTNGFADVPVEFVPSLKLRIDSQRPIFDAEIFAGEGGGVGIRWSIQELFLASELTTIEYRPRVVSGPAAVWKTLEVPPVVDLTEDPQRRTILVWPETSQRHLEFRLTVVDQAGNRSVLEREIQLPWVATDAQISGDAGTAFGSGMQQTAVQDLTGPRNVPWQNTLNQETLTHSGVGNSNRTEFADHYLPPQAWGSTAPRPGPVTAADAESAVRLPNSGRAPLASRPLSAESASDRGQSFEEMEVLPNEQPDAFEELPPPIAERSNGSRSSDDEDLNPSPADGRFSGIPVQSVGSSTNRSSLNIDEVARMTKERQFRLAYDLESVGQQGVAKVQLWMTDDGGTTWHSSSEDPDCQSPIAVELPSEGMFGFRLVVTARNGLAGEPPGPGQPADLWIGLDETPPLARLVAAPLGTGENYGQMLIQWEASDAQLAKRPITLHYASSANGPWSVLASGLPNTGSYGWTIVPSLPRHVFLRIEVKDRAGNSGFDTSPGPVDLSSMMPRGTLRGFVDTGQTEEQ